MVNKRKGSTPKEPTEVSTGIEDKPVASVLTDSTEEGAYLFDLDDDLENAIQPASLPDAVQRGVIKNITEAKNNQGQIQWRILVTVPPENYPADFPVDHAPDGLDLMYFSRPVGINSVGDTIQGRFEMKQIISALKMPLSRRIRKEDLLTKAVKFETVTKTADDGTRITNIKGRLEAI